jgi:hypothetical protein
MRLELWVLRLTQILSSIELPLIESTMIPFIHIDMSFNLQDTFQLVSTYITDFYFANEGFDV